ncbi:MAG: choice-of-anchor tandem repeat GloVer-containing protein, partial [Bacteroidia bacterium]
SSNFHPYGSLYFDGTYFYGTTNEGPGAGRGGTIFKIKPDGSGFTTLLNIDQGRNPYGSLISDGTFLYGMTYSSVQNLNGIIFKIKPDGTGYASIYNFNGYSDGGSPLGSLISDGIFLYGMTRSGGIKKNGTIFKIKPDGSSFAKLFDFDGSSNGSAPRGDLFYDGKFLYGMTFQGGIYSGGTLFKLKTDGTYFVKLQEFGDPSFGETNPYASLISDGSNLFGTVDGGTNHFGAVFKFDLTTNGINNLCQQNDIIISPNPATNELNIQTKTDQKVQVQMFDMNGKLVLEDSFIQNLTFNIHNLPKGIYFIKCTGEAGVMTRKIVIE